MKQILPFLLVLVAYLWLGYCHDPLIRRNALQDGRDARDNITIARMAAESFAQESVFKRARDSTARVIAKLRSRIPRAQPDTAGGSAESPLPTDAPSPSGCAGAPVVCDSLIVALDEQHVQDSLRILFYRGQVVAYRDTLVPALTLARDNWKRSAQKRLGCVGGVSAAVGLDGRAAVGVGATCGIKL